MSITITDMYHLQGKGKSDIYNILLLHRNYAFMLFNESTFLATSIHHRYGLDICLNKKQRSKTNASHIQYHKIQYNKTNKYKYKLQLTQHI